MDVESLAGLLNRPMLIFPTICSVGVDWGMWRLPFPTQQITIKIIIMISLQTSQCFQIFLLLIEIFYEKPHHWDHPLSQKIMPRKATSAAQWSLHHLPTCMWHPWSKWPPYYCLLRPWSTCDLITTAQAWQQYLCTADWICFVADKKDWTKLFIFPANLNLELKSITTDLIVWKWVWC